MGLSNDLISQFVKVTNNDQKPKTDTIMYGTVTSVDTVNKKATIMIDGAEVTTPAIYTSAVKVGEHVMVTIKNHTAVITGNVDDPSASSADLDCTIEMINSEFSLINSKFTMSNSKFEAINSEFSMINSSINTQNSNIETINSNISTINSNINTQNSSIETINSDVKILNSAFTIENGKLTGITHIITDLLDSKYATIGDLEATNADIINLTAENGIINTLDSNVAKINTLLFGAADGDAITTHFANTVIANIGEAQITSAMIKDIAASKITSGTVVTNSVNISSENGQLYIVNETIQIKDDNNTVRVQIGKDASNDYSINVWDQDGNLMFSEGGITPSAVKEAIIVNDMISDHANISGDKLDINSLFKAMNDDGSNTLYWTKVKVDEEHATLDILLESMNENLGDAGSTIRAMAGAIDINTWNNDAFANLKLTADGLTVDVADAAKTATNHLKFDTNGLMIGQDVTTTNVSKNVLITNTSLNIRNGTTDLATFSEKTINLGIYTDNSTINLCGGKGQIKLAQFGTRDEYLNILSDGALRLYGPDYIHMTSSTNNNFAYLALVANDPHPYSYMHTALSDGSKSELVLYADSSSRLKAAKTLNISSVGNMNISASKTSTGATDGNFYVDATNLYINYDGFKYKSDEFYINGRQYGYNQTLWSGMWYMTNGHTATLSASISSQPHGIVLVFAPYASGTTSNSDWYYHFVPKHVITGDGPYCITVTMTDCERIASKSLVIDDSTIGGIDINGQSYTSAGVTFTNNAYVLKYVIGV